jgi:hypothetical protein
MRGQPLNEMRLVFKRRSVPLSYPLLLSPMRGEGRRRTVESEDEGFRWLARPQGWLQASPWSTRSFSA